MIGKKFHRLTVLRFSHYDRAHRKHYLCQCECGKRKAVQMSLLKNGNTKSCGCLADEVRRVARRLPNNGGVINHLILQYKRHARNRGIPYRLSRDEFDALVRMPCHYCGVVGGNLKKTKNCREGFRHNGIDRVDSSRPYESGNVVPCCGLCNRAKRDMTREQFVEWAIRVAKHQGERGAMAEQWGGRA